MPVRNFTWPDLPALLDFIGAVQALDPRDREPRRQSFLETLREPGLAPESNCLLLERDGQILGCCLVVPEPPIRRAVLALDASAGLSVEDEGELVRRAVARAGELGATAAHICLEPGAPRSELLLREGFHLERVYLDMVWQWDELPPVETKPGFYIRSFQNGDAGALTEVQNAAFTGSWGFCPNSVEQIEYRCGLGNTSHQGILFLRHEDRVAGYCWTAIAPSGGQTKGIIGMIGVAPEYRGQGG